MRKPGRLRILVVDDDAMIAEIVAELLVAGGHTVCAIEHTEAAAVRAAAEHAPDLIIMDHHLECGSGLGAMAAILRGGAVAHILMSGDVAAGQNTTGIVLQKPFRGVDLMDAVERALQAPAEPAGIQGVGSG